jgi:hypothetical protein
VAPLKLPAARRPASLAPTLVFALLAVASVGAFFITTRLKRSTPVVQKLDFGRYLSPNGDGRRDAVRIRFRTKREDEVTVAIVGSDGEEVRLLARDRRLHAGPHSFRWTGRLAGGIPAPDGEYRVRVGLRRQARSITSPRKLFIDTVAPTPLVRFVSPDSISPDGVGGSNRAHLVFDGPTRVAPRLLVYRTDDDPPRLVARRTGRSGSHELAWDGLSGAPGDERPAPSGNYVMVVRTQDAAGNVGPVGLPPARGRLGGHPGLIVSYISAQGPLAPVRAGELARFSVEADGRRYRWRVRRLGSSHALERGSSRSHTLRVRAPHGRSGVFLLSLRAGRHRYETPFAVQAGRRKRVLVVLPATTWQARDPLDIDADGFPDTLPEQRRVVLHRPLARSGLPEGFTVREAPLLLYLDRSGLLYDITTDLALGAAGSRPLVRYRGVLFAGPPRFYSRPSGTLVRSYVEAGGRVAWIGTGGLTRAVRLGSDALTLAGADGRRNLFGELLRPQQPGGLVTVLGDRIEFLRGVGNALGPFPALEEGARPPRAARLLASAGRASGHPALVVYREEQGVVARVGIDGFARSAHASGDVERIMRRLWILLSR